jgi:hypothetical protein
MGFNARLNESVGPLNWITGISGIQIVKSKRRVINILNDLQAILLLISHLGLIAFNVAECSHLHPNIHMMFSIRRILFHTSCALFIVVIRRNMPTLRSVFCLFVELKSRDFKILYRLNMGMLLFKSLLFFYNFSVYLSLLTQKETLTGKEILRQIFLFYNDLNAWGIGSFGIYLFFLLGIHFLERDAVNKMITRLNSEKDSSLTPLQVYTQVQRFIDIKDVFCRSISFIPCLWFLFVFVKASMDIIRLKVDPIMVAKVNFALLILFVLEVSLLAVVTSYACNQSSYLLLSLEKKIVSRKPDLLCQWNQALIKIKEGRRFEYRPYGLFAINTKILLAFSSSLVTFTVLFVQLITSVIDSKT